MDPKIWTRKKLFVRWWAALRIEEERQCPERGRITRPALRPKLLWRPSRRTRQPLRSRRSSAFTRRRSVDGRSWRWPVCPTSSATVASKCARRPRPKRTALQTDRPTEGGVGLFKKKELTLSLEDRRLWIDPQHARLTIQQQCELLSLPRSTYYYQPRPESAEKLRLMRRLDELYLECPFFGSRRMAVMLGVNRKRAQRLMGIMGIEALYPKPNLSCPAPGHEIYPYLLRGLSIERPNQVWSTDITYIPMRGGFLYLAAVMDWFSRFVLSWELSNTMETGFCLAAQEAAFRFGQPEIWNSDHGSQFTAADFLAPLKQRSIAISMDGRGRALDNVFIERLWRSLKYELIYPGDFASGADLYPALDRYFRFYNYRRPHQALGYRTPADLYPLGSKRKRASL